MISQRFIKFLLVANRSLKCLGNLFFFVISDDARKPFFYLTFILPKNVLNGLQGQIIESVPYHPAIKNI